LKKGIKGLRNLEIRERKNWYLRKKEHLEELLILLKSVIEGERLLKKKTRTFSEFLKTISK